MSNVQRIYVVSFAPSYDESSVGGCEWRRTRAEAVRLFAALAVDEGSDLRLTVLDMPGDLSAEQITDFLGGIGYEVCDPPDPREDLDDALKTWADRDNPTCPECEAQGATQYLPCPAHPQEPKP